jgi:hypothetical protein
MDRMGVALESFAPRVHRSCLFLMAPFRRFRPGLLGFGYSPTLGVLDLAPLLDRILDGIPDRANLQDVDLFPCRLAHIAIPRAR